MSYLLIFSAFLLLSGCTGSKSPSPEAESVSTTLDQPASSVAPPPNFIVKVVEQVGGAVVRINSSRRVAQDPSDSPLAPFLQGSPGEPEQIERGTGSGFIFDANGLILTNRHVVNGSDQVSVLLKDGRELKGRVLGEDQLTDIAVVKIEASRLPTVKLGTTKQMIPGNWAIAIGNPLGLDNTVTAGIISAIGRPAADIGDLDLRVRFVQTDAAINPGNSGGPLLNERGEVIGVNTAIIQGAQGLGFAIPIEDAQRIAKQLVANGKVERAYLGVQMADITPETRDTIQQKVQQEIGRDKGVYVVEVMPNSPAAQGGIAAGDFIESVDEKPIRSAEELQQTVEQSPVGAGVKVTINRNGKSQQLRITLANLKPEVQEPQ